MSEKSFEERVDLICSTESIGAEFMAGFRHAKKLCSREAKTADVKIEKLQQLYEQSCELATDNAIEADRLLNVIKKAQCLASNWRAYAAEMGASTDSWTRKSCAMDLETILLEATKQYEENL